MTLLIIVTISLVFGAIVCLLMMHLLKQYDIHTIDVSDIDTMFEQVKHLQSVLKNKEIYSVQKTYDNKISIFTKKER